MTWPISQDYNEAIQSPETSFADPELKKGEVVCNALGIPLPRSGNFADVYEFRCTNGTRWAIKCFTREVAGLRERYQEISRALQDAKLPFTVEFTYLQEGILIRGQWYPILKMQWVEGLTFNDFVRQNLDKPAILDGTMQIWGRMSQRLRAAGIAHADLQHGNVLLVPGSTAGSLAVKLIDYDGMFVPSLSGKPSGEVGHPSYQHPQRIKQAIYSAEVDRFPLLLIATSLRCLRAGGRALWEKYDNGDNLLFRETDLKAPDTSKLFAELDGLSDAKAKTLVGLVRKALAGSVDSVPHLDEVLPDLASVTTTAPAKAPRPAAEKPARPAPATVQADAIATTAAPARAQTAAIQTSADVDDEEAEAPDADSVDVEPARRRKRRGKKTKSSAALWIGIGGAVAVGLLVIVGGAIGAIALFSGKSKPAAPDNAQQASVQPQSKDKGKDAAANGSGQNPPAPKDNKKPTPDKPTPDKPMPDKPMPDKPMPDVKGPPKIYDNDPRFALLDLHVQANMDLTKGIDYPDNTLEEVPLGVQLLADVPFWIQNRYLYFEVGKRKFEQIGVGGKFKKLHVLHGAHYFDGKPDEVISRYEIHYTDGTSDSIPVCYVRDVVDFWHPERSTTAKVAWSGSNKEATRQKCKISLFLSTYDNPHPEKTVQTIDYVRVNTGTLATFCVAMTVETGVGEPGFMPPTGDPATDPMTPVRAEDGFYRERVQFSPSAPTGSVAISPNGKFVLSCNNSDGDVNIWNVETLAGKNLKVANIVVSGLGFLPDNRTIIFGGDDNKAHKMTLTPQGGPSGTVATFGDLPDEKEPWTSKTLEVSSDGKFIWAAGDALLLSWKSDDGKIAYLGRPKIAGKLVNLSLAANGMTAVTNHDSNCGAVWKTNVGHAFTELSESTVAISSDGSLMVGGSIRGDLAVADVAKENGNIRQLDKAGGKVTALALSANNRYLAVAVDSGTSKLLKIFDMNSGKELQHFDNVAVLPGQLKFATASNLLVASTADSKLRVFDLNKENPDPVVRQPDPENPRPDAGAAKLVFNCEVGLSPSMRCLTTIKDGETVTVHSDGSVRIWNITKTNIQVVRTVEDPKKTPTQWAGVGKALVLLAGPKGALELLNLKTNKRQPLPDLEYTSIDNLEVRKDDCLAAISATNGTRYEVIVLDLKKGKEMSRIPIPGSMAQVRFMPGGEILTGGNDNCLNLWDPNTGKLIRKVWQGHIQIRYLSVTPDGARAIIAEQFGTVRAIDIATGVERYHLDIPPQQSLGCLCLSPNGALGVTSVLNGQRSSFQFFDVASGKKLGRAEDTCKDSVNAATFIDEEHLVVGYPANKISEYTIRLSKDAGDTTKPDMPPHSNTEAWRVMGQNNHTLESDAAPKDGTLIGLEIGVQKLGPGQGDKAIRAFRAIYQDANGDEVKGKQYGTNLANVVTVKAKPGYAVGGVVGKAGLTMDGMSVIFMKIKPDGKLDPSDTYKSDWIGGHGGGVETLLGGDGTTIRGITCRVTAKEAVGFGLVR